MKANLWLLSLALLFPRANAFAGETNTTHWGAANAGAQMSIRLASDNRQIPIGKPVELSVRFKNVSQRLIIVELLNPREIFIPILTDATGQELPRKPFPRTGHHGSSVPAQLKPGEDLQAKYDLRELYDLREPGRYNLLLASRFFDADSKVHMIASNWLTIELAK